MIVSPASVDTAAVEDHPPTCGILGGCGDRDGDLLTDRHRRQKLEILSRVYRSRTRQLIAEQSGNLGAQPHTVCSEVGRPELPVEFAVELRRADVARNGGEELHVAQAQRMTDACRVADVDFVEATILEDVQCHDLFPSDYDDGLSVARTRARLHAGDLALGRPPLPPTEAAFSVGRSDDWAGRPGPPDRLGLFVVETLERQEPLWSL
jgi:hypothetical protein